VGNENKRLFFAVNIPKEAKERIASEIMPLIPKESWRKVLPENLHITMLFLGYLPKEAIKGLAEKASLLESVESFEAEVNCAGHFKGRVLWLGFGKGNEELSLLSRKLCNALGVRDESFHAHITLARNKGMKRQQAEGLVQKIREKLSPESIWVESVELMESSLRRAGPEYSVVFSKKLAGDADE